MATFSSVLANKDNLTTFITCIRFQLGANLSPANCIRICNYPETTGNPVVMIPEPDYVELGPMRYLPFPFNIPELSYDNTREQPNLSLSFPIDFELTAIIKSNADAIVGKQVTLFVTTRQFLDASELAVKYIKFVFYIDSLAYNDSELQMSLSTRFNLQGYDAPRRRFARDYCPWKYKDQKDCFYNPASFPGGFNYFPAMQGSTMLYRYIDVNGNPTTLPEKDVCGKRFSDCRIRQIAVNTLRQYQRDNGFTPIKGWDYLPFGGFPAIPAKDPRTF